MFRKLLVLACIAASFEINSADTTEQNKNDHIFLQRYQANPPEGYDFLTACRTHDNQYLAVFVKTSQAFAIGDGAVKLFAVAHTRTPVKIFMGSATSASEVNLGTNNRLVNGAVYAELTPSLWSKFFFAKDQYFWHVKKCEDGKAGAILADTDAWQSRDVSERNPKIPKEAWLEILQ